MTGEVEDLKQIAHKIRCAFCLNSGAMNANKTEQGTTAYLCDDCHKAGYKAKFYHLFHGEKVQEVPIEQDQGQGQPGQNQVNQNQQSSNTDTEIKDAEEQKAPLSDSTAKEIAKAIEVEKQETNE